MLTNKNKMPFLNFTTNDTHLIVKGKSYYIREMLKLHGAKWNPDVGAWTLSILLDSPGLRQDFEETAANLTAKAKAEEAAEAKKLRDYAKSPEGIAEKRASDLTYAKSRLWTCCDNAYVMDLGRGHVGCHEHGFFVKGRLRTGD